MNNWRLWKTSKTFILEVSLIVFDSFLSLWTIFISCTTKVIDFFHIFCRFFFSSYWEIHLRRKSCAMVWLFFCFCLSSLIFFLCCSKKESVLYKDNNKTVYIYIYIYIVNIISKNFFQSWTWAFFALSLILRGLSLFNCLLQLLIDGYLWLYKFFGNHWDTPLRRL